MFKYSFHCSLLFSPQVLGTLLLDRMMIGVCVSITALCKLLKSALRKRL